MHPANDPPGPDGSYALPRASGAELAPAIDYQGDALELVHFLCDGLIVAHDRLETVYVDPLRQRIADRLARVLEKYKWDMSIFGPELLLAVALLAPIKQTAEIMREDWAADKVKAARPKATPTGADIAAAPGAPLPAEQLSDRAPAHATTATAARNVQKDAGAQLFTRA
jgi:hypothetical protein